MLFKELIEIKTSFTNVFDLIPNKTKTVFINKENELSKDVLRKELKILTLDQSYK